MKVEGWITHAVRFGVEAVFEAAVQDGLDRRDLDRLAVELRAIDPRWRPPNGWKAKTSVPDGRVCAWCGRGISGRSDRRSCSTAHRVALHRAEKSPGMSSTPRNCP